MPYNHPFEALITFVIFGVIPLMIAGAVLKFLGGILKSLFGR